MRQFEIKNDFESARAHPWVRGVFHEYSDEDGMTIRRASFPDISDGSPYREAMRQKIASYVERVSCHPEWRGPTVGVDTNGDRRLLCSNPVAEEMYSEAPAMARWRTHFVPSGTALYPLQCPTEDCLPDGTEIDPVTRALFENSLDGIGIRSRAEIMSWISASYINQDTKTNWTSLACGAAVPVLNAIQHNQNKMSGINLKLVDIDQSTLNFARHLALERGLGEGEEFELLRRDLLKQLIRSDTLIGELGEESMDLVDALGIFEYFGESSSVKFLKQAYRLVKPGGALVAANMLDTHPEMPFNQQVIGWPKIYPRSIKELKSILVKSDINLGDASLTTADDGIYAVLEIKKPLTYSREAV